MKHGKMLLYAMVSFTIIIISTHCKKDTTVAQVLKDTVITTTVVLNTQLATPQSSFFSVDSEVVFQSFAAAQSNCKVVDFIHCFQANEGNRIICAPSDTSASKLGDTTWTIRNATKFRLVNVTWSAVDTIAILNQTAASLQKTSSAFNLTIGDIYAFITSSGTKGLFKVTDTTNVNNTSVSITIEVKKLTKVY